MDDKTGSQDSRKRLGGLGLDISCLSKRDARETIKIAKKKSRKAVEALRGFVGFLGFLGGAGGEAILFFQLLYLLQSARDDTAQVRTFARNLFNEKQVQHAVSATKD